MRGGLLLVVIALFLAATYFFMTGAGRKKDSSLMQVVAVASTTAPPLVGVGEIAEPPSPPPPLAPRRKAADSTSSDRSYPLYLRYYVAWGFTNQLVGHLAASLLMRAIPFRGVILPYAVTKKVSTGLWDTRYCIALSEMFDVEHLKRRLREAGIAEIYMNPCHDQPVKGRFGYANTEGLPNSQRNFTLKLKISVPLKDQISQIEATIAEAKANATRDGGGPIDIIVDPGGIFGLFHTFTGQWKHEGRVVQLYREATSDWILSSKLSALQARLKSTLDKDKLIVWHLRGEADGIWMNVEEQVSAMQNFIRTLKIDVKDYSVYLATGMKDFKRNRQGSIQAVASRLTRNRMIPLHPIARAKRVFVSTDLVPEIADLSMEVAAAMQFFTVLDADYLFSVRESSWGLGVAQYRAYLRNNTKTVLFKLDEKPGYLLTFHTFLYRDYPPEFCTVNRLRKCP